MTTKEKIAEEINTCILEGAKILQIASDNISNEKNKETHRAFELEYQHWYSKTIKVIEVLAPERLIEFKQYYEIDSKRRTHTLGNYVIQDFIKQIRPSIPNLNVYDRTYVNLYNQVSILSSIKPRISSILENIENTLFHDLQNKELQTAKNLIKINLRASGSLAGVILESHLANVCKEHKIPFKKSNPTISDLNELLKSGNIYDTVNWRKISYLGDLRNICSHKKENDPTKEQVEELIDGVNWAIKNIN